MPETIRIAQALFGYQDGHHLIAATVELGPKPIQLLATATDASGPEASEGFEPSSTGLPLAGTNYYALFQTWSAPEMSRPGCVWSHVLLIELADLARIPDLGVLRRLFRRPKEGFKIQDYEKALEAPLSPAPGLLDGQTLERTAWLLPYLYSSTRGIVVLDKAAAPWEDVVYALWSQQWPRLRRNFSFSTGSLGDRRVTGVPFDLQIAPTESKRLWSRSEASTDILVFSTRIQSTTEEPWVELTLEDLREGEIGTFRKFLFQFGSDVSPTRLAFVALANAFQATTPSEEPDFGEQLAEIAILFPNPDEALALKRDQFGRLGNRATEDDLDALWGAVYFLLNSDEAAAFRRVTIDIRSWVEPLWRRKRSDILSFLAAIKSPERASEFLEALAPTIQGTDVPVIWREGQNILPFVIARNSSLGKDFRAWEMPGAGQQALWEALEKTSHDCALWGEIGGAMLRANCGLHEADTVKLAGTSLSEPLLEWLGSESFRLPSPGWRQALQPMLLATLRTQSVESSLLALTAWALRPNDARGISGGRADVQKLSAELDRIPKVLRLHAQFLLVTLGFRSSGSTATRLLSAAFLPVYDAVARSDYPGETWEILAPILPESRWGLDWDRCKRLRQALREWLRENPSESSALYAAIRGTDHDAILKSFSR